MTGDLREINILNHYIGMPPVEAPAFETAMFPIGIAALAVLCLLSPLSTAGCAGWQSWRPRSRRS